MIKYIYKTLTAFICIFSLISVNAVTLEIRPDTIHELRAGPHSQSSVERSSYFRIYHIPGMFSDERFRELEGLRTAPGRGCGPYIGADGGDQKRMAWDASVEKQFDKYAVLFQKTAKQYPHIPFAMAGGAYPELKDKSTSGADEVDPTMRVNHNQGFSSQEFDTNSGLIERWLDVIQLGKGSLPRYFSPLNEPDSAWKNSLNPAQDHADFAKVLAMKLKQKHPDVLVSGPCTAWAHPDPLWNRWFKTGWERKFIETAGGTVGSYDFHIYSKEYWAYQDVINDPTNKKKLEKPNLYEALKSGNPYIWDFGKAKAYLDLIYAYHQSVWNQPSLPVIISEFGRQGITPQKGPWASEYLYYLYGTTVTRLWLAFMDRPEIQLTVPFILPESDAGHAPQRGQALYTRPGAPVNMELQPTPLLHFYSFFREFGGERVYCKWGQIDQEQSLGIFALAVRKGDEIQILLHNSFSHPLPIDLKFSSNSKISSTGRIARMRWEGPEPKIYTETSAGHWRVDKSAEEMVDLAKVILSGEETAILKIQAPVTKKRNLRSERFYSSQTLKSIDAGESNFVVNLPTNPGVEGASMLVSLSAPSGYESGNRLLLQVNGKEAGEVDLGFTSGMRAMIVPLQIPIQTTLIHSGENRISIKWAVAPPEKGGMISSLRMDLDRYVSE